MQEKTKVSKKLTTTVATVVCTLFKDLLQRAENFQFSNRVFKISCKGQRIVSF